MNKYFLTDVQREFHEMVRRFADERIAPLLCAGIIGYRALARAQLPDGGRLALYGFGSSAHVVIQIAQHRGSDVFVVTRGERHRPDHLLGSYYIRRQCHRFGPSQW